jgi:hypothetical protein
VKRLDGLAKAVSFRRMTAINPDDVKRAADALTKLYGPEEALAKARSIEHDSIVADFAKAVREVIERNFKEILLKRI